MRDVLLPDVADAPLAWLAAGTHRTVEELELSVEPADDDSLMASAAASSSAYAAERFHECQEHARWHTDRMVEHAAAAAGPSSGAVRHELRAPRPRPGSLSFNEYGHLSHSIPGTPRTGSPSASSLRAVSRPTSAAAYRAQVASMHRSRSAAPSASGRAARRVFEASYEGGMSLHVPHSRHSSSAWSPRRELSVASSSRLSMASSRRSSYEHRSGLAAAREGALLSPTPSSSGRRSMPREHSPPPSFRTHRTGSFATARSLSRTRSRSLSSLSSAAGPTLSMRLGMHTSRASSVAPSEDLPTYTPRGVDGLPRYDEPLPAPPMAHAYGEGYFAPRPVERPPPPHVFAFARQAGSRVFRAAARRFSANSNASSPAATPGATSSEGATPSASASASSPASPSMAVTTHSSAPNASALYRRPAPPTATPIWPATTFHRSLTSDYVRVAYVRDTTPSAFGRTRETGPRIVYVQRRPASTSVTPTASRPASRPSSVREEPAVLNARAAALLAKVRARLRKEGGARASRPLDAESPPAPGTPLDSDGLSPSTSPALTPAMSRGTSGSQEATPTGTLGEGARLTLVHSAQEDAAPRARPPLVSSNSLSAIVSLPTAASSRADEPGPSSGAGGGTRLSGFFFSGARRRSRPSTSGGETTSAATSRFLGPSRLHSQTALAQ
ncbi:hypothetical protein FA09DRAFT_332668 [Tilletiopsis washingtonensis]|uniref:Uncharacterized protein n=1 Tax=Tilletiopsis washingtonensis TaxID=58919 RepID=A0A316YZ79_9BASI|nr:hypothetical protein FA09DRAFT_332668 [Tilletiopsis washingtonensis]PWN94760.1 hypothetical protein FA09DRAFT_332668 [Tilletiopsis washingtonensis]